MHPCLPGRRGGSWQAPGNVYLMSGVAGVALSHPLVFDAGPVKAPTPPGPLKFPSGFPAHALLGCAAALWLEGTWLQDTAPAQRFCQSVLLVVQEPGARPVLPQPATGSPLLGQRGPATTL